MNLSRNLANELQAEISRRAFLGQSCGLGAAALSWLSGSTATARSDYAPTAKRVIYLFMSGGPSHVDTFDYKPELTRRNDEQVPESLIDGIHFAMIKTDQTPLLRGSPFRFQRHGEHGAYVSELLPHLATVVDELAIIKSLRSEVFNHDPAVSLLNCGDPRVGRPTMGAWLSYGLGKETEELPAYVVLTSGQKRQPLLDSYWTNGFLPSEHQGVRFRSQGDPVLFLSNSNNITRAERRQQIDLIQWMNEQRFDLFRDPETRGRIAQYETAFRMQTAIPSLMDYSDESRATLDLYGIEPGKPSFANNCLMARRMAERGVRFIQLYDMGWDSHGSIVAEHQERCQGIDQGAAALIRDLKQRGMLDDTLVIWGGEFGRTPVAQGGGEQWGRDHHPHGFTMWMAGGGIRGGVVHGSTDDFGFHAVESPVSVHDFHATALHCLGINHEKLTYRHQGRDFRLTDVAGEVVAPLLS